MTDFDAEARIDEPSRAAMEAAVELEIDSCIGHITTRGLASKLDKIAAALTRAHPAGTQDREALDHMHNARLASIHARTDNVGLREALDKIASQPDIPDGFDSEVAPAAACAFDECRAIARAALAPPDDKALSDE